MNTARETSETDYLQTAISENREENSDKNNVTATTGTSPIVVQQPVGRVDQRGPVFMAAPQLIPDVPRGLEYLASVNRIAIHELDEKLEVFTGMNARNRFSLCNQLGQQIYFAYEPSAGFMSGRTPCLYVMDNTMNPVMYIHRPRKTFGYSYECFVECPPGLPVGRVVLKSSCGTNDYSVEDIVGNRKLFIKDRGCCENVHTVYSLNNTGPIGDITRSGLVGGSRSVVKFPVNLDVYLKASLLGATFLMDWIAYEAARRQRELQRCNQ